MKTKMTMVVALAAALCSSASFARGPHGGPGGPGPRGGGPAPMMHGGGPRGGFHPAPPPRHHGGHHHGGAWGRGGRNFWPGFVGGVIGGALVDAVVGPAPVVVNPAPVVVTPAPVVVTPAPVVQQQNVWVEGRYIDQIQPNGTIIRVWQPGHYETRQVVY